MGAEGWRVIAEDPRFPTDDVIVAFCSVTDPQYKLPADPAKSDCTPAIQRALDDASAAGGGTVFLPEGKYRLEGMLTIASNVILRGRWSLISPDRPAAGTILMIHNKKHEQSLLLTGSGCGVRDLTFWHPEQKLTDRCGIKIAFGDPRESWGCDDRKHHSDQSIPRHRSFPGEYLLPARHLWKPSTQRVVGRQKLCRVAL
jgi:hypothetical protein